MPRPSATDRFFLAPIVNGAVATGRTLNLSGGFVVIEHPDEDETELVFPPAITALVGDVVVSGTTATVVGLDGEELDADSPANHDILQYDSGLGKWINWPLKSVNIDEMIFGENERVISKIFERTSTDDSGETIVLHTLDPNEQIDITVTAFAGTDIAGEVFLIDLRRQLGRNGSSNVAACTGDVNEATVKVGHNDNNANITFTGTTVGCFFNGTGGEDQNWTIEVTITRVQKGGT